MKKAILTGLCLMFLFLCTACGSTTASNTMQDGTYSAQMADFNFGWKEYVTITVKNGKIVSTEYNAENASGMVKSWDNHYMTIMKASDGTYPNEYTRYYAAQLTGQTEAPEIETLSGASSSAENFKKLSAAVVEQALKGDSSIAYVESTAE